MKYYFIIIITEILIYSFKVFYFKLLIINQTRIVINTWNMIFISKKLLFDYLIIIIVVVNKET